MLVTDIIQNPDGSFTIPKNSKFYKAIQQELKQNPALSNYPGRAINQVYQKPNTAKPSTQNLAQPIQLPPNTYKLTNNQLVRIDQGKVYLNDLDKPSKISWASNAPHSLILKDLNDPARFQQYFPEPNTANPSTQNTAKPSTQNTAKPSTQNLAQPIQSPPNTYKLTNNQLVRIDKGKVYLNDLDKPSEISWASNAPHSLILKHLNEPGEFERYFPENQRPK